MVFSITPWPFFAGSFDYNGCLGSSTSALRGGREVSGRGGSAEFVESHPAHLLAEIANSDTSALGLWASERAMLVQALHDHQGNKSKAARTPGVSRDNLRYRVKKYQITDDKII